MKTFNFMSTMLTVVMVCLFCSFKSAEVDFNTCGTIITQDDIMRTQTEDIDNSIEQISLRASNGTTYFFDGCGNNTCDFNIRSLPVGIYDATVITAFCSFNTIVSKK